MLLEKLVWKLRDLHDARSWKLRRRPDYLFPFGWETDQFHSNSVQTILNTSTIFSHLTDI